MKINPRAGNLGYRFDLVDLPKLITAYYEDWPDPHNPHGFFVRQGLQRISDYLAGMEKGVGELLGKEAK